MMAGYETWRAPTMAVQPIWPMPTVACAAASPPARRTDPEPPAMDPHSPLPGLARLSALPGHIDVRGMAPGSALPLLTGIPWASDWHLTPEGRDQRAALDEAIAATGPRLGAINGSLHWMLCHGMPHAADRVLGARSVFLDAVGGKRVISALIEKITKNSDGSACLARMIVQGQLDLIRSKGSHCMDLARTFAEETLAFNVALALWLLYAPRLRRGMSFAELLSWVERSLLERLRDSKFCFTSFSAWAGLKTYGDRAIIAMVDPRHITPQVFPVVYGFLAVVPKGARELIDSIKDAGSVLDHEGRAINRAHINLRMVDVIAHKGMILNRDVNILREVSPRLGTVRRC